MAFGGIVPSRAGGPAAAIPARLTSTAGPKLVQFGEYLGPHRRTVHRRTADIDSDWAYGLVYR